MKITRAAAAAAVVVVVCIVFERARLKLSPSQSLQFFAFFLGCYYLGFYLNVNESLNVNSEAGSFLLAPFVARATTAIIDGLCLELHPTTRYNSKATLVFVFTPVCFL